MTKQTFYYIENGRMTIFDAEFEDFENTRIKDIYAWLIDYIRNALHGPPDIKRQNCGYITELNDYR